MKKLPIFFCVILLGIIHGNFFSVCHASQDNINVGELNIILKFIYRNNEIIIITFLILILVLHMNIRSLNKKNRRLQLQNERFKKLSEISDEYIFEYDVVSGKLILSDKCEDLLKNVEKVKYYDNFEKTDYIINIKGEELEKFLIHTVVSNYGSKEMTFMFSQEKQGIYRVISLNVYSEKNSQLLVIGKLEDISREVEEKKLLKKEAQLDKMTGILNSAACKENIRVAISNMKSDETGYLILFDIDNFKRVNDTYGHIVGDEVIMYVASTLKDTFRSTDIVGRVGGDEFCAFMYGYIDENIVSQKLEEIRNILKVPGSCTQIRNVTISMGSARVCDDDSFTKLYDNTDKALYRVKQNGKNNFEFYHKV